MGVNYCIIGVCGGGLFFLFSRFFVKKIVTAIQVLKQSSDLLGSFLAHVPISPLTRYVTRQTRVATLIEKANRPQGFGYDQILGYKQISVWVTVVASVCLYIGGRAVSDIFIVFLVGIFLSLSWPELCLVRIAVLGQAMAKRQLPRAIDLMQVYIVAGYNLDQAIAKAGQHLAGEWGRVFSEASFRLSIGVPFNDVFTKRAFLLDADFKSFFSALKLARRLGVSLSHTLEVHGSLLRSRRRQEAEEAARQASVLISFPLVLCIFPALLIIYLAPAILTMVHSL